MNRKDFLRLASSTSLMFGLNGLNELHSYSMSLENTEQMPALFLGHGNPMNAIEENEFVKGFRDIAQTFPKPKAILCISAHTTRQ